MLKLRALLLASVLGIVLSGSACSRASFDQAAARPATVLTVAAASDLRGALDEIAAEFEAQTGYRVRLLFGSSGQVAQQIENGAPYDVFASASLAFIERLAQQALIDPGSISLYARGRIVLATNKRSGVSVQSLGALADPAIRRVTIANPAHAPYGIAAREALIHAGVWEAVRPRLVLAENVLQASQYVQTGDAPVGIIALSIAVQMKDEVEFVLIDESAHAPLRQAIGIVSRSINKDAAQQFIQLVVSEQGQAVLRRYGFEPPAAP
ncbi:MAG: molybdate ABC transporter substrate-binding protein [Anaerolineae bacterium]|nr:molybdate ABC transporter substrate-binding protein [Thermoflexales bacterium]MDW8395392.1 molybdate ABC transporter substrate-binding protein [Anaerolineae bacterium]